MNGYILLWLLMYSSQKMPHRLYGRFRRSPTSISQQIVKTAYFVLISLHNTQRSNLLHILSFQWFFVVGTSYALYISLSKYCYNKGWRYTFLTIFLKWKIKFWQSKKTWPHSISAEFLKIIFRFWISIMFKRLMSYFPDIFLYLLYIGGISFWQKKNM